LVSQIVLVLSVGWYFEIVWIVCIKQDTESCFSNMLIPKHNN
jgi:hypothetical protein